MKFLTIFPFIFQTIVWIPTRFALWFFIRFRVEGTEHLKGFGCNALIAANHQSELDPILVPASLNPFSKLMPMFYISRERDFYEKTGWKRYIYGGLLFKLWGAYPAFIGKGNYEAALVHHLALLRLGKTILVFPEGGKTKDGFIHDGKGGITYLAHMTDTPIIPLSMSGHYHMTWKDFFLRRRSVTMAYGKPLLVRNLLPDPLHVVLRADRDDYLHAAQMVMKAIRELYAKYAPAPISLPMPAPVRVEALE